MRIQAFRKPLLSIAALFVGMLAYGQQPDSLMHYIEIATKNNPTVLQRLFEYQSALQKAPQVGSLPDPELNIGVFLKPMDIMSGKQIANVTLMQMFPWYGVLGNAKDEMSLMAKAKYESFYDTKLQVAYDVKRSWYNLLRIQQTIRISTKNLEILRTIERLSLAKFKAATAGSISAPSGSSKTMPSTSTPPSNAGGMQGMGGSSGSAMASQPSSSMQGGSMAMPSAGSGLADLYRIQIEISDLENDIAQLNDQQKTAIASFNSYLNRPLAHGVTLPDTLKAESFNIQMETTSDSMFANNPMLTMLQYEQQSLDARKRMVSRMGYPMVGLGLSYSIISKSSMSSSSMNGKDMLMPMVSVTLPIFRKKYRAMQTETELMKAATEQSYTSTSNSLQAEYYEAMQLYKDARRRTKLYADQSMLAQKSLDIMLKSYTASGANLSDILRIRQQLLSYEQKQVDAIADYNTAIAWLNRLTATPQSR